LRSKPRPVATGTNGGQTPIFELISQARRGISTAPAGRPPYRGVCSNALTLPPGLASIANVSPAVIIPFLQPTDIGIKRDTTSIEYRWTPTDAWDIKANLSHLRRTGTQVDGIVGMGPTSGFNPTQVPAPVSDTTQNFGLKGEYVGSSFWGQRYNFKLAYKGSQYTETGASTSPI